jgi:hypothetical protein
LSRRRNLAAIARPHGAEILTEGEQVKTAWHYQPLSETLQLPSGGKRQQIERFGAGAGYRARNQRGLGSYIGVDKTQLVGAFSAAVLPGEDKAQT